MTTDMFVDRHIGPRDFEIQEMLDKVGVSSLDELMDKTVPASIRLKEDLKIPVGMSEYNYLKYIGEIAAKNRIFRSYIGTGYYNTISLSVVKRNILENPGWYTSYTPYQAEISQGRLEALLNFQTMVMELTSMEIANASLLDESTAAAEAMIMMYNLGSKSAVNSESDKFFVDKDIFPQSLAVISTRAEALGIQIVTGKFDSFEPDDTYFGGIVQYPNANGNVSDYASFVEKSQKVGMMVAVIADLMSLVLLSPPGEWGADIVVGNSQRFGVPMGYGGPHAAYFATREKYKRSIPGRIIGVSVDRHGKPALRMALQTREQHIKREKATSNICTAQALLATMAGMYAVYHGPQGLRDIAGKIHFSARSLEKVITGLGFKQLNKDYFDSLHISLPENVTQADIMELALSKEINFRYFSDGSVGISLDETVELDDLNDILWIFASAVKRKYSAIQVINSEYGFANGFQRKTNFLKQEVFQKYQSETELMRYIKRLENKDYSLVHSMIPLGSCTMKLNAASELFAFLWPGFANIHPFVPLDQVEGYQQLFNELGRDLCEITGFEAISFQPNSGASGEYAGLMVIREYHKSRAEGHRNIVLIPSSAHGTNPASAVMAGMKVVVVDCDHEGNIQIDALRRLAEEHKNELSAFMVTYPSTHGVFEEGIMEMIQIVHKNGGQVYMDGANMNAQVGLTNPGVIGADVCHLNLHKTFAIPHGGGGPGVGPIAVAKHLVEFLPAHPLIETGGVKGIPAISAAPYGSSSILTISHAYIKMMGGNGLTKASMLAILNANYISASLRKNFDILYTGKNGFVAHEMILDCRNFKSIAGITEADISKRLMDYGFHAPTLSFPVHGTLMVEPTESESLQELDRFCQVMNLIHDEIMEIADNKADKEDNVLKNAPHTVVECTSDEWKHSYSRSKAAFALPWLYDNKIWPSVGRIDDAYGDRNLMCSCAPLEEYRKKAK